MGKTDQMSPVPDPGGRLERSFHWSTIQLVATMKQKTNQIPVTPSVLFRSLGVPGV